MIFAITSMASNCTRTSVSMAAGAAPLKRMPLTEMLTMGICSLCIASGDGGDAARVETIAAPRLRGLDADEAGHHENDDIIPSPDVGDDAGVRQGARIVEHEGPEDAGDVEGQIGEEDAQHSPLHETFRAIAALGRHLELVTLRLEQADEHRLGDVGRAEKLTEVGHERDHAPARQPGDHRRLHDEETATGGRWRRAPRHRRPEC